MGLSRDLRREAGNKREEYKNYYVGHFSSLLHNSFSIKNADELPKRYLIRTLINFGFIVYDKATKLYLRGSGLGIDIYGLPQQYVLYGANGFNVIRNADEVVVLRANDLMIPIKRFLEMQARKLADFDMAIEQNLEAIKTMTICGFDTEKNLNSFVNMTESRRVGATYCYVNKNAMSAKPLYVDSTGAQYLVTELQDARKKILDETYQKLGVQYANTDKKERVQATEVNASLGLAVDSIMSWIDTFNYDAEYGGIPIRLELKTSLMDLYVGAVQNLENIYGQREQTKNNLGKDKTVL